MEQESDEFRQQTPETRKKESEGGLLSSREASLPEGIQAVNVTYYRIGNYSYTNFGDAMAELRRQSSGDIATQEVAVRELRPK